MIMTEDLLRVRWKMEDILYKRDFVLWVDETVKQLKSKDFSEIDLENLIDEVESLGKRDKRELKSRLITLFEHLLKRRYVSRPDCYRDWEVTIHRTQSKLKDLFADSPSLGILLEEIYLDCYEEALGNMQIEYDANFPETYPFLNPTHNLLNKNIIEVQISLDPFEDYFHKRAEIADTLAESSSTIVDSLILSTTALDALAKIWLHDFPEEEQRLKEIYDIKPRNNIPSNLCFSRFLKEFAKNDPDANKVAVVCFAEQWKLYDPNNTNLAEQLLQTRLSDSDNPIIQLAESPKSWFDVSLEELGEECPLIFENSKLRRMAEEYEYGSMVYKFYRCPLVHSSKSSVRVNGFVRGEEISYRKSFIHENQTTIGIGPQVITRWLRKTSRTYALTK